MALILAEDDVEIEVVRSYTGTPHPRVRYHCPPSYFGENAILVLLWKVLITIRLVLSGRFDVIYAIHSVPHLYLGYLASAFSRKPLVYSVIGGIMELKRHGWMFQKMNEKIARRATLVIVNKKRTVNFLTQIGFRKENVIRYRFLNLIAASNFYPLETTKSYDLIVVSWLLPGKHIDLFIDIVDILKQQFPNITAAIVGDGALRETLEDYSKSKGLSENVKFLGYISDSEKLNRILNSSKIFVLNSSYEGGPFTIVEAMFAGICCVASRVGEVPFRIKHGYNGFIVDRYDDIDEYVILLSSLLENEQSLQEMQKNASKSKENHPKDSIRFWHELVQHLLITRR
jgi:glycosyltransferase involved in cell wall biosynthesis